MRLGSMPENLRTKPTLVWQLEAKKKGTHQTEVSYLTEGMSWRADYRVTIDSTETLSVSGWVTINNFCGVTFPDARLKLIAGDVNIIEDAPPAPEVPPAPPWRLPPWAPQLAVLSQSSVVLVQASSIGSKQVRRRIGDLPQAEIRGSSALR